MARPIDYKNRKEREEAILKSATVLFSNYGYSKTSMTDIAAKIGVSSGTIFQYYKNKDELFEATVLNPLIQIKEQTVALLRTLEEPVLLLKNMITYHIEIFPDLAMMLKLVQYVMAQKVRFQSLVVKVITEISEFTIALESVIKRGQEEGTFNIDNPMLIADSYLAYINGVSVAIDPNHCPHLQELMNHGLSLFKIKE